VDTKIANLEKEHIPTRYLSNLGTFGRVGQKRLLSVKVTVVGLGGLGGYVIEQLARSGVGAIIAIDNDRFEESNLNRQLFADSTAIGRSKVDVAKDRVLKVNDAVKFFGYGSKVEDLPAEVYNGVELIFDCLDQIYSKLYLEELATRLNVPLIHGAIAGWYGQVAVIWPASKLLSKIYSYQKIGIEKKLGNPPFTPAVASGLMVSEGIKVILGHKQRKNEILFFDLLNNEWEILSF